MVPAKIHMSYSLEPVNIFLHGKTECGAKDMEREKLLCIILVVPKIINRVLMRGEQGGHNQ